MHALTTNRTGQLATIVVGMTLTVGWLSGADLSGLVTAAGTWALALIAITTSRDTARQAHRTLELSTFRALDEQWLRLNETRSEAAKALRKGQPNNRHVDALLDFFEMVAEYVEEGSVDERRARDAFRYYMVGFWRATREYRAWVAEDDPEVWAPLERISRQWAARYPLSLPEGETVARFLADECGDPRLTGDFESWRAARAGSGT